MSELCATSATIPFYAYALYMQGFVWTWLQRIGDIEKAIPEPVTQFAQPILSQFTKVARAGNVQKPSTEDSAVGDNTLSSSSDPSPQTSSSHKYQTVSALHCYACIVGLF